MDPMSERLLSHLVAVDEDLNLAFKDVLREDYKWVSKHLEHLEREILVIRAILRGQ